MTKRAAREDLLTENQRLRDDLVGVQYALLAIVTTTLGYAEYEGPLWSYDDCATDADRRMWRTQLVAQILPLAQPTDHASGVRARCPLCGRHPWQYPAGYLIPGGLTRHLAGTFNVARCDVMQAASAVAVAAWTRPTKKATT